MRNIFLFIRQYFNLISFLILQIICIVSISKFSKTHEAFFSSKANEVTGVINSRYNNVTKYFNLAKVNEDLALENNRLRNLLQSNIVAPDSSLAIRIDTLIKDTLNRFRKYTFLPATVVGNTVSLEANFISLERGANQGVKTEMGVLGPNGIVGKVVSVSDNYSVVMSLLNRNSKVSAMLKNSKDQYAENVEWDGEDPDFLVMRKVSKSVKVQKGDTVVTSRYSPSFPSQLMIGTVDAVEKDDQGNTFTLRIKSATNFRTIQHVNIIVNHYYTEQFKLDSITKQLHFNLGNE